MANRTRIKICGITEYCDTQAIIEQGVDALGFIFVKESPRCILPEVAREIIRKLPPLVDAVGVFMNEDPLEVNDIAQYCGLSLIQLHGSEPPEYCQTIDSPVIKAFRVQNQGSVSCSVYADVVKGFLFDTYSKNKAGGTGEVFDWQQLEKMDIPAEFILAGGLTPENIGTAIATVRPFAVDVNSGVETAPGRKDIDKIVQLVAEVRKIDQ
nr:phosphoribosylanthranilate isomerase [Desulfobulbaceae bacterium]